MMPIVPLFGLRLDGLLFFLLLLSSEGLIIDQPSNPGNKADQDRRILDLYLVMLLDSVTEKEIAEPLDIQIGKKIDKDGDGIE